MWYDNYTNANIIQLPVDEINQLRGSKVSKKNVHLAPRAIVAFEEAVGDQVILNWLIIGSKGNHGCIFAFYNALDRFMSNLFYRTFSI